MQMLNGVSDPVHFEFELKKRHFSCLHHVRGASDYIWQNLLSKVELGGTPTFKPVEVGRRHCLLFETPTYI